MMKRFTWKRAVVWLGFAVASLCAAYVILDVYEVGGVPMPEPSKVTIARTDQGWTELLSRRYHHTSQGTRILPYKWFMALERPTLDPIIFPGKFAARSNLERFGFLYDDSAPKSGTDDLPIGFAIDEEFYAPYASPPVARPTPMVGLTCAACHTGRLDLQGSDGRLTGVLIEGGSGMINLGKFQEAAGLALGYTLFFKARFSRFAEAVLGERLPSDDPRVVALQSELKAYVDTGIAGNDYAKEHKLYPVDAGFSRTDALGLIGNRVFGPLQNENQTVTDAPVNFPHLWDTPWFDWVQYNASIRLPMSRNIGEALGVGAAVKLALEPGEKYETTVRVENLAWIEEFLGGSAPFEGLKPPSWKDLADRGLLPPIDQPMADKGEALYRRHCERCHLPARTKLIENINNKAYDKYWDHHATGDQKFLRVPVRDLDEIGTDPNQAANFYRRFAVVPMIEPHPNPAKNNRAGTRTISAEEGLYRVTSSIRRDVYNDLHLFEPSHADKRERFDRYRTLTFPLDTEDQILERKSINEVIINNLGYKARPLDGIWATPPFLHNGSVPNLYQILVPATSRSASFYLGTNKYDAVRLGYETEQFPNAFLLDTTISGNRNSGHEFRNLELEELEATMQRSIDKTLSTDARWANVLGITENAYKILTPQVRWEKIRALSHDFLNVRQDHKPKQTFQGVRGVLGAEFSDEERWEILEYLKTL